MSQRKLTIFSLPRELRDEIWTLIVSHDVRLISGQYTPLDIYKTPKESRQHLTVFSLILVNRAVKREITVTFRKRCTFTFHTSSLLSTLLVHGFSSWGRPKLLLSECPSTTVTVCPRILLEMGHVSVFPNGPVNTSRYGDSSFHWSLGGSRKRKMYAHAAHPPGWKTLDPGAGRLLNFIHRAPMKLRSLQMSAILLFSIRIVRQLRRLRGIDLHFAFIPDETELPDRVLAIDGKEYPVKWLAETADTKTVLPIYKTEFDIVPVSVAPLSCLVVAIRREVASSQFVRRAVRADYNRVDSDPPLWIDFDDESIAITKGITETYPRASLSQPASGWYRYSARSPGVACLEMAEEPIFREPLKRKMLKRQRQEWGRQTWEDRRFRGQWLLRSENVDIPRALRIYHMNMEDVVVAQR